jgi:beta-lactamase class A
MPGNGTGAIQENGFMPRITALFLAMSLGLFVSSSSLSQEGSNSLVEVAVALEEKLDARIGLAVYDLENQTTWEYRADERFPMASTFKAMACAALLSRGEAVMNTVVEIAASDLVTYSPVTEALVGQSVPASELCRATMRTSDNTAANKVLQVLGGPEAVTQFLRVIGDETTRLDRWEPDLNQGTLGDLRDTTTPKAIARSLHGLVLGDKLDGVARKQFTAWLLSNKVGDPLLRAGIPPDWRIADRTGAGGHGTRGIIAVMWPPNRAPLVAAIYLTETAASMEERNAAIAEIGAALAALVIN